MGLEDTYMTALTILIFEIDHFVNLRVAVGSVAIICEIKSKFCLQHLTLRACKAPVVVM
jgi:hypothetical protein